MKNHPLRTRMGDCLNAPTRNPRPLMLHFGRALIAIMSAFVCLCQADSPVLSTPALSGADIKFSWTGEPSQMAYRLEYTDDLSSGTWQVCFPHSQWPIGWTSWLDGRLAGNGQRFYRLSAEPVAAIERGHAISNILTQAYSVSELANYFKQMGVPLVPESGVDIYLVTYETVTARGLPSWATGALLVPQIHTKPLPLLSYQHGTVLKRNQVPSLEDNVERFIGLALAGTGYMVVIPDYLGLGLSQGMHPYIHADSEASAVIDMLRAARTFCAARSIALNGQLFLAGYSQGGHATLAAQREMELHLTNEFPITASAPMAGPYDVSGTMAQLFLSGQPYVSPCYVPYVVFAYHEAYGVYDDLTLVFKAPYATTLPPLFDGLHDEGQVNALMPPIPSQIFQPDYLTAVKDNPSHPFNRALRQNDLWDWKPLALTRFYHCHGDTTVPYANSEVALREFQARGAPRVELVDPYPEGNHNTGAPYCLLAAKLWFDTLKR
jgi:hypothetical protein